MNPDIDQMSDEAVEEALRFLAENAAAAGMAKAQMIYLEHYRKSELARLKRAAPPSERTDAAREAWARDHEEYKVVLDAQHEAVRQHEVLSWQKSAAEARISAWQTKNANNRAADRVR